MNKENNHLITFPPGQVMIGPNGKEYRAVWGTVKQHTYSLLKLKSRYFTIGTAVNFVTIDAALIQRCIVVRTDTPPANAFNANSIY